MGYTKTIVTGFSWVGAIRIAIRGITLLKTAIIARILSPSQLGVFTIATLVLGSRSALSVGGCLSYANPRMPIIVCNPRIPILICQSSYAILICQSS